MYRLAEFPCAADVKCIDGQGADVECVDDWGADNSADVQTIEKSNLSRQFLFRNYNVGQSKSIAAVDAIRAMNPSITVDARQVPL